MEVWSMDLTRLRMDSSAIAEKKSSIHYIEFNVIRVKHTKVISSESVHKVRNVADGEHESQINFNHNIITSWACKWKTMLKKGESEDV